MSSLIARRQSNSKERAKQSNKKAKQSKGTSKTKQHNIQGSTTQKHEIQRESYRLNPRRCDAHEPADLDIGIAKQSKQSKARPIKTWHDTSKHSKANQGTTRQSKAIIGFSVGLPRSLLFLWPEVRPLSQPIRSRHGHEGDESRGGPSEGDARIAIVDGEAGRDESYWAVVEVHGEGVEGLGDEGQGAVVEGRGEVVEGNGAVVEGDEQKEEESVEQRGEGHGCAAGWLVGDEG